MPKVINDNFRRMFMTEFSYQNGEIPIIEEEHKVEINIIDAVCGAGKTSAAINMINSSDEEQRFLYITPYLDEVQRITQACKSKNFQQPEMYGSKLNHIKYLFEKGVNIVSTHALFKNFDTETIELVRAMNYILVMDEVAEVVEPLNISKSDLQIVLQKTEVQDNGLLKWTDLSYSGELGNYRRLCELNAVFYHNNTALLYLFPVDCFKAFRQVYILTYMFDAQVQRYYYDFYGAKFKYIGVAGSNLKDYRFVNEINHDASKKFANLINIEQSVNLNAVGEPDYSLSVSWYDKNIKSYSNCLKANLTNFFINKTKTPSSKNLWTVFKDYKKQIQGKGYTKSFLSCNARATNAYKDRTAVAYMCNIFFNPILKNFFEQKGVRVEEDKWALSELLQFLFRSAIRQGEPIKLYIPSKRMRRLLQRWIVGYYDNKINPDDVNAPKQIELTEEQIKGIKEKFAPIDDVEEMSKKIVLEIIKTKIEGEVLNEMGYETEKEIPKDKKVEYRAAVKMRLENIQQTRSDA